MVYHMRWSIDGGCRGNGSPGSVGAAAAVLHFKNRGSTEWTRRVTRDYHDEPEPTSQRMEMTAMIMALEKTLDIYDGLRGTPDLDLLILADSKYVVGCMTDWIYKWCRNGWRNAAGGEVANRDLIEKASDLDDRVRQLGSVTYEWMPRDQNVEADGYCRRILDGTDQAHNDGPIGRNSSDYDSD